MKERSTPNLVDWISISLRWLILLGLAIALGVSDSFSLEVILVLLAATLWNIGMSLMVAFNRSLPLQAYWNVAIDLLVAILLYSWSGILGSSVGWAGLLPVTSAALYLRLGEMLLAVLVSAGLQGVVTWLEFTTIQSVYYILPLLGLYLVYGLFLNLSARQMVAYLGGGQQSRSFSRQGGEQTERERTRALYKLISALSATLNYQRVMESALDLSYSTLATTSGSGENMVGAVLQFSEEDQKDPELYVGSARRFTPADMRITWPGTEGLLGRTIEEGEPQLAIGLAKDPELSRIIALRSCRTAYCIPLRVGLDTYGVLLFAHPDGDFFTVERREILDILGSQTVIALQNARLYRDLEQEKERIMEIQEEARRKLARDLHDGPTQSVAALAMRVNFTRRQMDKDPKSVADELYKIEDLARRTTKEIRHMLFTLRPLVLESEGLVAALDSMALNMKDTYNQNVIVDADPDVVAQMELNKQGVIFYIAEEAVNNSRKHAQASKVWVRIKSAEKDIGLLEIEDNGIGFDLGTVENGYDSRGSLGMVNMRERAELVNGVMNIETTPGKGTRIRLLIPFTEEATDHIRRGL